MAEDRIHWPVGDKTRCNIPVMRSQRISRSATMHAPRRVYRGQVVEIPKFLQLADRCRRCAVRLRRDTGLIAEISREEVQ